MYNWPSSGCRYYRKKRRGEERCSAQSKRITWCMLNYTWGRMGCRVVAEESDPRKNNRRGHPPTGNSLWSVDGLVGRARWSKAWWLILIRLPTNACVKKANKRLITDPPLRSTEYKYSVLRNADSPDIRLIHVIRQPPSS
jgi:hypothetical protein